MRKETDIALAIGRCGFFRSSVDLLLQEVEEAVKKEKTVMILTGSKENNKKIEELFEGKSSRIIISHGTISTRV